MPGKEPMIDPRTWRVWRYALIGLVGGVGLELTPKFIPGLKAHGQLTPLAIWITTVAIALGVGWAYFFARKAFHASDEYRRATQQWAWYRGSLVGMMTAVPFVVFIALGGLPLLGLSPPHFADTGDAFAMGFAACALAEMVGYAAIRFWRATRP